MAGVETGVLRRRPVIYRRAGMPGRQLMMQSASSDMEWGCSVSKIRDEFGAISRLMMMSLVPGSLIRTPLRKTIVLRTTFC